MCCNNKKIFKFDPDQFCMDLLFTFYDDNILNELKKVIIDEIEIEENSHEDYKYGIWGAVPTSDNYKFDLRFYEIMEDIRSVFLRNGFCERL